MFTVQHKNGRASIGDAESALDAKATFSSLLSQLHSCPPSPLMDSQPSNVATQASLNDIYDNFAALCQRAKYIIPLHNTQVELWALQSLKFLMRYHREYLPKQQLNQLERLTCTLQFSHIIMVSALLFTLFEC